jgi:predicted metal-dependent phosphoesterase TrpH
MIDLHIHTTASDGSMSPSAVVCMAVSRGLTAIAITDHDSFDGYDQAAAAANQLGVELVCGIEISTRMSIRTATRAPSVHLLAYFLDQPPAQFRTWIREHQESRHRRNIQLINKLRELGCLICMDEAVQIGGAMTGRPHFARLLVRQGYVNTIQEAFDRYLADDAAAGVEREQPELADAVSFVSQCGGLPVLAHPVRLSFASEPESLYRLLGPLTERGLAGLECYYSDHSLRHVEFYQNAARHFGLLTTGGSDFHGDLKPGIELGSGRDGNLAIPHSILSEMKAYY